MAASLGSITLNLHLTTEFGGPILLGEAKIDVPAKVDAAAGQVVLTLDTAVLRHEIANALIDAARQIERPEYAQVVG